MLFKNKCDVFFGQSRGSYPVCVPLDSRLHSFLTPNVPGILVFGYRPMANCESAGITNTPTAGFQRHSRDDQSSKKTACIKGRPSSFSEALQAEELSTLSFGNIQCAETLLWIGTQSPFGL